MSSHDRYDVAVIGGGPAGAAAATLIAQAGLSVALYEMAAFPRFHIGESLIPAVNLTLEKLGVLADLDGLGCPRKHGVQFFSPRGSSRPFYFSESHDPRLHQTWQVRRSDFDRLLFDNAANHGVEVHAGIKVADVQLGENPRLSVLDGARAERTVEARVVVDASGQRGVLARQLGGREDLAGLMNVGVFAHFRDVVLDEGIDAGSTLIYRLSDTAWIWFIPLPDVVSIGLVMPASELSKSEGSPETILDQAIDSCAPLKARMSRAARTTEVRVEKDFTYRMKTDGGKRWLLVGDALGFIDPMYSSGLYLTMLSAELAAAAVTGALRGERRLDFRGFSSEWQVAFDQFLALVRAFYQPGFRFADLAKNPDHRRGLVDLLIGDVTTPYAMQVAEAVGSMCDDDVLA